MTTKEGDLLGILSLLARYTQALDERDWAALDEVFTEDAVFEGGGYVARSRAETVALILSLLGGCGPTQHLLGSYRIEPDGERARSRSSIRAFHLGAGERAGAVYEMFGEYTDELVRTPGGWRIAHRRVRVLCELGDRGVLRPGA